MEGAEVLTREQLKRVMGGDARSGANKACKKDSDCGGKWVAVIRDGDGKNDDTIYDPEGKCRNNTCVWSVVF